jgi:hypothetical protein
LLLDVRCADSGPNSASQRNDAKCHTNRRRRRAYIVTQAAFGVSPALAPQKTQPPLFSARETGTARAWSTLRSCTLPTIRPTLYAEWTDIELVRELSPGRAEVPVSYWQRRCRRQASHFNRPTSFLPVLFAFAIARSCEPARPISFRSDQGETS